MVTVTLKASRNAAVEALPPRSLLSGEPYITYNASTRIVAITGAADGAQSADVVTIDRIGSDFVYSVDLGTDGATGPYTAQYPMSAVGTVRVSTGDGDDTVYYRCGRYGDVQTGPGNDTIYITRLDAIPVNAVSGNAGDGDDSIYLGENGSMDAMDGFVSLSGGNGYDTMYADDQASAPATYTVTYGTIERAGAGRIPYAYADRFVLTLPDAGSTLNVGQVTGYGSIVAIGGAGDDAAHLGDAALTLDGIDGAFTFEGGSGNNVITFRDDGLVTDVADYVLTSTTLTRSGMATVTFSDASVSLHCGAGADTIRASLTTPLDLTVNGYDNPTSRIDTLLLTAMSTSAVHQSATAVDGVWRLPAIGTVTYSNVEEVRSPLLVESSRFDVEAQSIEFDFAGDVGATLDVNDIVIRDSTSAVINVERIAWDAAERRARFFLSTAVPLVDGAYTATLAATFNDGAAMLNDPHGLAFSMLLGDLDADGAVGFSDLLIVAQNYGQTGRRYSQGNLDRGSDGLISFEDLLILAQRYGNVGVAICTEPGAKRRTGSALSR